MKTDSWSRRPLGECARFMSGGTPSKTRPDFWEGEIPWVSSGEMTELRIHDTPLHISEEAVVAGSRLVPENTVLAVVRGMSLAKEFRVSITRRAVAFNQDLKAFECAPGIDPEFLFYALLARKDHIRDLASEASHGTKRLETNVLSAFEIHVPSHLQAQRRVVALLSAYDDLIENNRRRMALLEEAARQLYREWFVRLCFPGHEHTRITNGVPEGWEQRQVGHLTSFLNRGIAPHYDDDAESLVINQKCIRAGRLNLSLARRQSRAFKPERQVQQGDVLVNSTGEGTLGRVAQVLAPIENCTVDTHVTIVRPTPGIGIHYFGQALMEFEPRFSTMGRGATNQTELSRGQIGDVQILVPPRSLVLQFEDFAASSFRQVWLLIEQNEKLRTARDLLLPRLMSGEISV